MHLSASQWGGIFRSQDRLVVSMAFLKFGSCDGCCIWDSLGYWMAYCMSAIVEFVVNREVSILRRYGLENGFIEDHFSKINILFLKSNMVSLYTNSVLWLQSLGLLLVTQGKQCELYQSINIKDIKR